MSDAELLTALDGGEEHRRVVLDSGPAAPGAYAGALRKAKGALKGRLLSVLGRREEALAALRASVKAGQPRSKVWLAEELIFAGRLEEAAAGLEASEGEPWAAALRAAALLGLGRDASAALEAASRRGGEEAALARALTGLSLGGEDLKGARRLFRGAAALSRGRAWPFVLSARVSRAAGDRAACLEDLDSAVAREPRAWVFLERSRILEELGDMDRALADCDAAIAAEGETPELLQRRAHVQICRRHYHLAEPDLGRAALLARKDPRPLLTRSQVRLIRGDIRGAASDAQGALMRGDDAAALEAAALRICTGRLDGLEKLLGAIERRSPELSGGVSFQRGSLALKRRDYAQAAEHYALAAERGGPAGLGLKAGFHRTVALGLGRTGDRLEPPPGEDAARLVICGLGIRPPYTATLDALRMVAACDFVFNNLSEPEIGGLIWLLSDEGEPTMFDVRGADARWTRTIFRHVSKGRTTGFVTRGHPHVCGGLAASLIAECRRQGVEWRVYPAVSSMDTLAFEAFPGSAAFWGQQVLDWSTFFVPETTVDARVPCVVYFNASVALVSEADYRRFCDRLASIWGAAHRLLFYGRSFNERPESLPVSALRRWHGRIDPSFTLLIPPR